MRADEHQRASRESPSVVSGKISTQFPMLLIAVFNCKGQDRGVAVFDMSDLIDLQAVKTAR
jgi:hypothetical protein